MTSFYQYPNSSSSSASRSWQQGTQPGTTFNQPTQQQRYSRPPASSHPNPQTQQQRYSLPPASSQPKPQRSGLSGPPPPSAYWKNQASIRKGVKVDAPVADYSDVDKRRMDFCYSNRGLPQTNGGIQQTVNSQEQHTYQTAGPGHHQQPTYQHSVSGHYNEPTNQQQPAYQHYQQPPNQQIAPESSNNQQFPPYQGSAPTHYQEQPHQHTEPVQNQHQSTHYQSQPASTQQYGQHQWTQ